MRLSYGGFTNRKKCRPWEGAFNVTLFWKLPSSTTFFAARSISWKESSHGGKFCRTKPDTGFGGQGLGLAWSTAQNTEIRAALDSSGSIVYLDHVHAIAQTAAQRPLGGCTDIAP